MRMLLHMHMHMHMHMHVHMYYAHAHAHSHVHPSHHSCTWLHSRNYASVQVMPDPPIDLYGVGVVLLFFETIIFY